MHQLNKKRGEKMPKAKAKKKTDVSNTMEKSVFLHGSPNIEKYYLLKQLQQVYTDAINSYISLLISNDDFLLQILKNDHKDSDIRKFEKTNRIKVLVSAYSQNAFDEAVTLLHNRMADIKSETYKITKSILASVTTLYYCVLTGKTKADMVSMLVKIRNSYKSEGKIKQHQSLIDKLNAMSDEEFGFEYDEVSANTYMISDMFKIPYVKKAYIKLDNRLSDLEPAAKAKCDYVLSITIPEEMTGVKRQPRMQIPLYASEDSIRRLHQYKVSKGMSCTVKDDGKIEVKTCIKKKPALADSSDITKIIGVDVGISDVIHTSDNKAIGSFSASIKFYKDVVEPLLGQISSMRNKKRKLKRYLKKHKKRFLILLKNISAI